MAILQDQDARFKHLERKIGTFVLIAISGIVLMIVGIGMKQELFTPKTTVHFITDSAQDIAEGTAVKLRGFDIGKVEKLALTDDARVQVTLSIRGDSMKWVRKDSKARLVKEGFIGAAVIDISPGTAQAPQLQKNELIAFARDTGLGDVVSQLRDEVVPILQDVKRLTHALQDPDGDFRQTLRHTNVVLANLPETQKRLNSVLGAAADELPATLRSTRETVEGTKKVVDSVSRTWPISRNIEPTKPKTLRPDSYGAREGGGRATPGAVAGESVNGNGKKK